MHSNQNINRLPAIKRLNVPQSHKFVNDKRLKKDISTLNVREIGDLSNTVD